MVKAVTFPPAGRAAAKLDGLTGLPGRDVLLERLGRSDDSSACGMLCIDIDQMSIFNEALGLTAGDMLIAEVARRIASTVDAGDFVARLDGDEFALLFERLLGKEQIEKLANSLMQTLCAPYLIAGQELLVSVSIGGALDSKQLLAHAQTALAQAKTSKRGCWLLYSSAMARTVENHFQLEGELRQAIVCEQFQVYYQPKAQCRNGAISGFEALVRWEHPRRGIVSPTEFIPSLEKTGLIEQVGAWVLRTACAQLKAWFADGFSDLQMAVNLSVRQLSDPEFPNLVRSILEEIGIPAGRIEMEVTESMLMHDISRAELSLRQLSALGLQLSIDDFGTGYSSLSYLKCLPITCIKVDRSFVKDITIDPNDASITRAIISMAHSLKMKVVAEGVESEAQISTLVADRCDYIQGYYISKPVPAQTATGLLRSGWTIPDHLLSRPAHVRTLLLVDDEESILLALRRLLRKEGYHILCGKSGAEGLELLATHDVDVVISDQRMPEMTGVEFLRRTREMYPQTIRLVLSGFADMASITHAINQGSIYKFLSKPWDEKSLKEGIREAFERKEKNDSRRRLLSEVVASKDHLERDNQLLTMRLNEQAHSTLIGRTALNIAQDNLTQLPVPVLAFDPAGLLVLRNDAFKEQEIDLASCLSFVHQFPPPNMRDIFKLTYKASDRVCWQISARHLHSGKQHRGTVLVFISVERIFGP